MDMRTGKTYDTKKDALRAGVPASDIAEVTQNGDDCPEVRFASGPFKNRVYRRAQNGQLVRVSVKRGDITKTDGAGNVVRVKA